MFSYIPCYGNLQVHIKECILCDLSKSVLYFSFFSSDWCQIWYSDFIIMFFTKADLKH